jgi:hypothetical protein
VEIKQKLRDGSPDSGPDMKDPSRPTVDADNRVGFAAVMVDAMKTCQIGSSSSALAIVTTSFGHLASSGCSLANWSSERFGARIAKRLERKPPSKGAAFFHPLWREACLVAGIGFEPMTFRL